MPEASPKMTHIRLYRDHDTNTWALQHEYGNGQPGPLRGTSEAPTTIPASEILAALEQGMEALDPPPIFPLTVYVDPAEPDAPERQA